MSEQSHANAHGKEPHSGIHADLDESAEVELDATTGQTVTASAADMPNPMPGAAASLQMSAAFGNAFMSRATSGEAGALGGHVAAQLLSTSGGGPTGSIQAMLQIMRDQAGAGPEDNAAIQQLITKSTGSAMGSGDAARFGAVLGADLSDVTVHTDSAAQEAAAKMGAHAFAIGTDVYFGSGEYAPDSAAGKELMLHELQHVVQHKEGRLPTGGSGLSISKPSDSVEREARAVAAQGVMALSNPIIDAALASLAEGTGEATPEQTPTSTTAGTAQTAMRDDMEGSDHAEEEDDSWLIAGIKQWWPELGEVIDKGFVEALSDDLMEAADAWLEEQFADINVDTFAQDIADKIGGAAGNLVGASLGCQDCCEAFESWIGSFTAMADHFTGAQSPIAMLSDLMTGGVSDALAAFGRLLDGTGVMEAVGGVVTEAGLWIEGLIQDVRDWNQSAGDWLVAHFGATANDNGFVGIITDAATALFTALGESIQGAIDTLLQAIFSIEWISDLHAMVDFALEMRDGVAWLQANWGDPNIWERVEELKSELPVFADLLLKGKGVWDTLSGQATEGAASWLDTIDAALESLGLPKASAVYTFIKGIVEGVRWIIDSPVWGEISGALAAAWEYGSGLVIDLIDIAVSLSTLVASPLLIFPFIVGSGLLMLPDCYKAPIFDFLISIMVATSAIWMLPMLLLVPFAAPMMQIMLEGTLQGMKDLDVAQKEAMLTRFAELLQLRFLGEFARGLIVGIVEGIVYEIISILQLIKLITDLANPFTYIGWMFEAFVSCLTAVAGAAANNVMETAEAFDRAGDRAKGEDDYAEQPDVDIDQAPQAPSPEAIPETPDGASLMDPSSWPSIESLLGGLVDGALQFLTDKVAEAAQGVAEALLSASEAPYTLGYGVGYIVGWALVQFGLLVLTAGFGEALNLIKNGAKALWLALKGGWKVMVAAVRTAITSIGTVLDDLAKMIGSISIPGLGKIGTWLRGAWAKLVKWFDDFVNWVKGSPKKKPGKGKKPKKGKDDDDPNLKSEAQKEADAGWKLIDDDKQLDAEDAEKSEIEAAEDKREKKSSEHTLDFTLSADKSKKTYQLQAEAKSGTKKATAKSKKKGWVADELEGTKLFFAPESAEKKNKESVEAAEADFQTKWDARTTEDPMTHMNQAGTSAVSSFDSAKLYPSMKMDVTFSNPKPDEGTIQYRVTVSPNVQDTGVKTLSKGSGEKPSDRFAEDIAKLPAAVQQQTKTLVDGHEPLQPNTTTWAGDAVPFLKTQAPFTSPMSGSLESDSWDWVAEGSSIVKAGRGRGYSDELFFGGLEKDAMGVDIDDTGMGGAREKIIDAVLTRDKTTVTDEVKTFLKNVPSAQITGEQNAQMSDLMDYAGWVNNLLGYAWPKHISWKTTNEPDWRGQNHHVWPQFLGGVDVPTLSVVQRFHQSGLHTTDYEPTAARNLKAEYPWVDRNNGKATTDAYSLLTREDQEEFVDDAAAELNDVYDRFQTDWVRRGNFEGPAGAIIDTVDPADLVGGKP